MIRVCCLKGKIVWGLLFGVGADSTILLLSTMFNYIQPFSTIFTSNLAFQFVP